MDKIFLVIRDEKVNSRGFYFPQGTFIRRTRGGVDSVFIRVDGKKVCDRFNRFDQTLFPGNIEEDIVEVFLPESSLTI